MARSLPNEVAVERAGAAGELALRPPRGLFHEAAGRLLHHRTGVFGLACVGLLVLTAVVAPLVTPHDPIQMDLARKLRPPSAQFLLGTDEFGRDILSRIILGTRLSLQVGLISVGLSAAIGTLLGLVSGYYGRWLDMVTQRVIEIKLAF